MGSLPHAKLLEIGHCSCCPMSPATPPSFPLDRHPEKPVAKGRFGREPPAGIFYFAVRLQVIHLIACRVMESLSLTGCQGQCSDTRAAHPTVLICTHQ